jgi:hypothetical protein
MSKSSRSFPHAYYLLLAVTVVIIGLLTRLDDLMVSASLFGQFFHGSVGLWDSTQPSDLDKQNYQVQVFS